MAVPRCSGCNQQFRWNQDFCQRVDLCLDEIEVNNGDGDGNGGVEGDDDLAHLRHIFSGEGNLDVS